MKKIILLALTILVMVGCSDKQRARAWETDGFETLKFDSCEYVFGTGGYRGYLAHKGNCRFCKERRQKELEELVIKLKEK